MSEEVSEVVEPTEPIEGEENTEVIENAEEVEKGVDSSPLSAPQTYKVKVDGEELEVDLDTLLSGWQQAAASQQRFKQATDLQKVMDNVMTQAKEDPAALFEYLGLNPRDWSEQYLMKVIEDEMMTPEQKAAKKDKEELESFRRQQNEAKQQQEKQAQEAAYKQAMEEIDADIADALKASGLKPSPKVIARIAEQMLAQLEVSGEIPKAASILDDVRASTTSELQEYLGALPPEKLLEALPKEVADTLRKAFVQQAKAKVPSTPSKVAKPGASKVGSKLKSLDELLGK